MSTPNTPTAEDTAALSAAFDALAAALDDVLPATEVHGLGDEALLTVTRAVEVLGRRVDALRAHCAGEVAERSPKGLGAERLSARNGCRTPAELTARLTGVTEATAARRATLGQAVTVRGSLTGGLLPPKFPAVSAAVAAGDLGEDAARIIISTLSSVELRADPADWAAAEAELVASAVSGFTADQTRVQATVWRIALDPDGVETDAEEAMRHRTLTRLGTRGGLVRYRMELMPEISGKLEQALTAVVSPKSRPVFLDGDEPGEDALDERSSAQRRHDAFASLIESAARSTEVASMGGAAPTVLVTVDQHDLAEGRGAGWIDGVDEPIPMSAVTQFACAGGIQKLLLREGKILSLWAPERCFTAQQRRAIAGRDRTCVIPGCRVPAGWCEYHHVIEHSRGGPTHTSNGAAVCWYHHQSIDTGAWAIRMHNGKPQVRAPRWIDPHGTWRDTGTEHRKPKLRE